MTYEEALKALVGPLEDSAVTAEYETDLGARLVEITEPNCTTVWRYDENESGFVFGGEKAATP